MITANWNYFLKISILKTMLNGIYIIVISILFGATVRFVDEENFNELLENILNHLPVLGLMVLAILPFFILGDFVQFRRKLAGRAISDVDRDFVKQSVIPDSWKMLKRWRAK